MTAARLAAYRALRDVLEGSDLPAALARVRDSLQDDRDRALVTELTGGVLRWMAALDAIIEWIAGRPTTRLDAEVLAVLRLGAYQILYLDRVPAAAGTRSSAPENRAPPVSSTPCCGGWREWNRPGRCPRSRPAGHRARRCWRI